MNKMFLSNAQESTFRLEEAQFSYDIQDMN